jgi:hypothetical protein
MHSTTSTTCSNAASSSCNRQRRQAHRPQVQRHAPRPLPLLEAIEGLSQALNVLQASLGSSYGASQAFQSGGHPWPQRQSEPQAIAMPWLSDAQVDQGSHLSQALDPESREPQESDWESDPWTCPWDELSVVELRSLLRCYPIDRRRLPAPIENLRRSELIEALSELQEVTG